jgi:5-(carboxyamino)imidazole ribonucleotide synthase
LTRRRISRVGIVGAGQLGRMLALAGIPLGLQFEFLDRDAATPGGQVAPLLAGALDDPARLAELRDRNDVLTFDWENVPRAALATLGRGTPIRPSPRALGIAQDRLQEKALFMRLGIPVTPHARVDTRPQLDRALAQLGLPGILKTRRLGYDGKGQAVIRSVAAAQAAWERLGGQPLIYEAFQAFSGEVSIIGARSPRGELAYYPLAANTHADGILRYSVAPLQAPGLQRAAQRHLRRVLLALDYVGVLAIEFFIVGGRLMANEMAPRVHNSGHWTIEGCVTSQFENHLRAICDLPLGSTRPVGHAAMVNFLGDVPAREALLGIDGLAFHDYGKTARAGRKVGHCTILRDSAASRDRALRQALALVTWT